MTTALHKSGYGPLGNNHYPADAARGIVASPNARWVYFAERDGLVKIGWSANPVRRAEQLAARLLAVMPGGRRMERLMHSLFDEYRVHGEWFNPGLDLIIFIEALHGDDPYRKVDLPREYSKAEVVREVAAQSDEEDRAKAVDAARAFTIADSGPLTPSPADRAAADLIGRILSQAVSS